MPLTSPSCVVALSTERNCATAANSATEDTTTAPPVARKPVSLQELRAQLRAQQGRNSNGKRDEEKAVELRMPERATATPWGWKLHYPDSDPVAIFTVPTSTHAEVLRDFPGAIAAEPFKPSLRQPTKPMTADDEAAIRAWLAHIEETDPYIIADVLERCRNDADARDYFIGQTARTDERETP